MLRFNLKNSISVLCLKVWISSEKIFFNSIRNFVLSVQYIIYVSNLYKRDIYINRVEQRFSAGGRLSRLMRLKIQERR